LENNIRRSDSSDDDDGNPDIDPSLVQRQPGTPVDGSSIQNPTEVDGNGPSVTPGNDNVPNATVEAALRQKGHDEIHKILQMHGNIQGKPTLAIASIVSEHVFPMVKFITKDAQLDYDKGICNIIMKHMTFSNEDQTETMEEEEKKKKTWWSENSSLVRAKLNLKRNNIGRIMRTRWESGKIFVNELILL